MDSNAFLRESGIRVFIDPNVEQNVDRAIELINRTNQLNFTKNRLPEDQASARNELFFLLNRTEIQAGLVRVFDRYGDYGHCGLYVQHRSLHTKPKLLHFCFSCRTLGMEVETWLYHRLGRPNLTIIGDVVTDIMDPNKVVDWIQLETKGPDNEGDAQESSARMPAVFIRGGCETVAIAHYFEVLTDRLVSEFSFERDGFAVRFDHSMMLKLALEKPNTEWMESLSALGYQRSDFETALLERSNDRCVYVLGFMAEIDNTVFRHKQHGFRALTYLSHKIGIDTNDLLSYDLDSLPATLKDGALYEALLELRKNYEYEGCVSSETTRANICSAIKMTPTNSLIFLLGGTEKIRCSKGVLHDFEPHIRLNQALKACAREFDHVIFLDMDEHIKNEYDRTEYYNHFSRHVYFRMFAAIRAKIDEWTSVGETA